MYVRTHDGKYVRTYVHTYIHSYIHTYIRTYIYTYINAHSLTHSLFRLIAQTLKTHYYYKEDSKHIKYIRIYMHTTIVAVIYLI